MANAVMEDQSPMPFIWGSADHATTADNATHATTADTATMANAVNGTVTTSALNATGGNATNLTNLSVSTVVNSTLFGMSWDAPDSNNGVGLTLNRASSSNSLGINYSTAGNILWWNGLDYESDEYIIVWRRGIGDLMRLSQNGS